LKLIKGWALKNNRGGLVWKINKLSNDPIKTALFCTRGHAMQFAKNMGAELDELTPVRVDIDIREANDS
jgi:hypothetical protein